MSLLVIPPNPILQRGHPLAKKLVSLWALDHTGDLIGHSLSKETATEVNGIPAVVGKYGRARRLNGSDQYFTVDQGPLIYQQTGGFTVGILARVLGQTAGDFIYSEGSSADDQPLMAVGVSGDSVRFLFRADTLGTWYNSDGISTTWADTDWHAIVVVIPAVEGVAKIYADGVLVEEVAAGTGWGTATTLDRGTIGALGRTSVGNHTQSDIAQIAGWHRPLSQNEVLEWSRDPSALLRRRRRVFVTVADAAASALTNVGDIPSDNVIGSPTLTPGAVALTGVGSIESANGIGLPTLTPGVVVLSGVGGIGSDNDVGLPALAAGAVALISVGGIGSDNSIGFAVLIYDIALTDVGDIDSNSVVGLLTLTLPSLEQAITGAGGIDSNNHVAVVKAEKGLVVVVIKVTVSPSSIESDNQIGSHALNPGLHGESIADENVVGSPTLTVGAITISGVGGIESYNRPASVHGTQVGTPDPSPLTGVGGVANENRFGLPTLTPAGIVRPLTTHGTDGVTTTFLIGFGYLHVSHLTVFVDGIETTDWTLDTAGTSIVLGVAPQDHSLIMITRTTPHPTPIDEITEGSTTDATALNRLILQCIYYAEEVHERALS